MSITQMILHQDAIQMMNNKCKFQRLQDISQPENVLSHDLYSVQREFRVKYLIVHLIINFLHETETKDYKFYIKLYKFKYSKFNCYRLLIL